MTDPVLLCFSHLRWDFVFQRPQHLMRRWARSRRVLYFEEPLFDVDTPRVSVRTDFSGVEIVTPHLPLQTRDEPAALRTLLDALLREQKITSHLCWYYTPRAIAFSRHLKPQVVVYDCMDEPPVGLRASERELLQLADVVFTGGQLLYEAKQAHHPNVFAFPSSVDVAHFAAARTICDDPVDQAPIPHPRLGFCGVLDERLDVELIGALADLRPDWQVVLLGPVAKIDPAVLPRRPNIHYLGRKAYAQLPQYLASWDVALLPFALNAATRFLSPTKTPEYLAGGLPVISTPIHEVVHPYGDLGLVRIAGTAEEFEGAALECLGEDREARLIDADTFLAELSWDKTWLQMKQQVDRSAGTRRGRVMPWTRRPRFDFLVAGAGFSGAVMAERLAEHGKRVLLVDKRPHVGGNTYDALDAAGIRVHAYGPHVFHTHSDEVFAYLSRFTEWRAYEHRVLAHVDGKLLPFPINLDTVNGLYGWDLTSEELAAYFAHVAEPVGEIRTAEDVIVSTVGRALYEKFFHHYTFKQWGLYPAQLDATVVARIPVRTNRDDRRFNDTHQAMPREGYSALFKRMLDHENITLELGTDYRDAARRVGFDQLVYSGPVDAYFEYCFGRLPYRSIDFRFETLDRPQHQPVAVVNHPNEHAYTRVTEFSHLTGQVGTKTTLVYEYPCDHGEPYFPVPCAQSASLYRQYQDLAQRTSGVHFVGRLATYRNSSIDQVVAQALTLAAKLVGLRRTELLTAAQGLV